MGRRFRRGFSCASYTRLKENIPKTVREPNARAVSVEDEKPNDHIRMEGVADELDEPGTGPVAASDVFCASVQSEDPRR